MARIFVDTNVLFPFSVMDVLLALSEDGVHEVLWTDDLLDEWERVIVREGKRAAESAATITSAIRQFFDTVVRVAAEKRRPPRTTADLLAALAHAGVPEFATRVRSVSG